MYNTLKDAVLSPYYSTLRARAFIARAKGARAAACAIGRAGGAAAATNAVGAALSAANEPTFGFRLIAPARTKVGAVGAGDLPALAVVAAGGAVRRRDDPAQALPGLLLSIGDASTATERAAVRGVGITQLFALVVGHGAVRRAERILQPQRDLAGRG